MTEPLKAYVAELDDIVKQIENKTGYIFDEREVWEVFAYTLRKCEVCNKSADYVPVLFENELRDCLVRAHINFRSEQNRQHKLELQPIKA